VCVWSDRSSPVLLRFSKQLKLRLSDAAAESVDGSSAGFLAGSAEGSKSAISTCSVKTHQHHLCLTDSLTEHCCSTPPVVTATSAALSVPLPSVASQLTPASEPPHIQHTEKNIFTSIRLSDLRSDQPVKPANEADKVKMLHYEDSEMSAQFNECRFSSSSSVTECSSCPASVVCVSPELVEPDHPALNWSEDICDVSENSSPEVVPSCSNCYDDVCLCVEGKVNMSAVSVEERLVPTSSVSVVHCGMSFFPDGAEIPALSSDSLPLDITVNVTEVRRTPLQRSDLCRSHADSLMPDVSFGSNVHSCVGTSESFVDKDQSVEGCSSVSSEAPRCSVVASVDNLEFHSHMPPEPHQHQSSASVSFYVAQSLSTMSCTSSCSSTKCLPTLVSADNLFQQQLLLTTVPSSPVPVSLFCAQTCTMSAPVPVALFCAQSCSSAGMLSTTESSQDISPNVSLASCSSSDDGICSSVLEVSLSVSTSEIPSIMVQHNLSQLAVTVDKEAKKDRSDGSVSKYPASSVTSSCHTRCSTGVSLLSDTAASDACVKESCKSVTQCPTQSTNTSESTLPASTQSLPVDQHRASICGDPSTDSISHSQPLPSTNRLEIDSFTEERTDISVTDSDVSKDIISDLQHFPATKIGCQTQKENDLDVSNYDVLDDNMLHLQQLPITNKLCGAEEDISVSTSDEPSEQISDELIVSQILAAVSYQCEPLDPVFISNRKWREMLSPVVSRRHFSEVLEENSDSLSLGDVVTAEDANSDSVMDDTVSELIRSTEMNLSHRIQQQEDQQSDLGLLSAVVPAADSWMCDDKVLQDVLCSLLNSCHVNSTDADNSLPLSYAAAAATAADDDDDDDDDDAGSCCSSSTEVYVDLPEDLKPDDVSTRCDSRQDRDSDGTVSLLSVVLDGDGLDLMDSTSDGFQNIYSSLVDPAQLDTELCSDVSELTSGPDCNSTVTGGQPTNLSAFSVEDSLTDGRSVELLLDKERCLAVMALDAGLVKNLPCSTAAISSLCDRLEESKKLPNKDMEEDSLKTYADGTTMNSVSCHCSQLHVSKKSCRSSLRMPEKLADIDPASPLLACRPPPLSAGCGRYATSSHHTLDMIEGTVSTDMSSVTGLSQDVSGGRLCCKRSRKRKHSSVSFAENKADIESLSSAAETKSRDKSHVGTLSPTGTGKECKNNLKSVGDADKDRIASKCLSRNSAVEMESSTMRIHSASQIDKSVNHLPLLHRRRTLSEERRATRSMLISQQKQQTIFTLEDSRSGSSRTVILNKPTFPPMLTTGRKAKSKGKLEQVKGQRNLNHGRSKSDLQHEEKERNAVDELSQQPTRDDDGDDGADEGQKVDDLEVNGKPSEGMCLTKKKVKKKRKKKKMQSYEVTAESCSSKTDAPLSPDNISQDNGSRSVRNKSDNVSDGSAVVDSGNCSAPRGRPRKKCSLLAQLENSEGYVTNRNVPVSDDHNTSLLWTDTSSLSREERALQVGACYIYIHGEHQTP